MARPLLSSFSVLLRPLSYVTVEGCGACKAGGGQSGLKVSWHKGLWQVQGWPSSSSPELSSEGYAALWIRAPPWTYYRSQHMLLKPGQGLPPLGMRGAGGQGLFYQCEAWHQCSGSRVTTFAPSPAGGDYFFLHRRIQVARPYTRRIASFRKGSPLLTCAKALCQMAVVLGQGEVLFVCFQPVPPWEAASYCCWEYVRCTEVRKSWELVS